MNGVNRDALSLSAFVCQRFRLFRFFLRSSTSSVLPVVPIVSTTCLEKSTLNLTMPMPAGGDAERGVRGVRFMIVYHPQSQG